MKVKFEFTGMMKQVIGWKKELEFEVPEGTSILEALRQLDETGDANKRAGFAILGDKKVELSYILQDGDFLRIFPKAFGG